jgi:uncharacterized membrane protein YbaN (DUF454 family)
MATRLRAIGIELVGWSLLALAVLLAFLPILPTLLFLGALLILSSRYKWASRLLEKTRRAMSFLWRPQRKRAA